MEKNIRAAIAAASMAFVWSAFADEVGHSGPAMGLPAKIETAAAKGILPIESRTMFALTLGKHSLADVKARLGEARVMKLERTEGRPNALCYRSPKAADNTVVLFEAGPLGGFEKLTAVTVGPASAFGSVSRECAPSGKVSQTAAKAGKLKVGAHVNSLAASLKSSFGTTKAGLVEMPFEKTVTTRDRSTGKPVEMDISSGVVGRAENGILKWFSIYYIESL